MKPVHRLLTVLPPGLLSLLEMFHAHGHHDAVYETLKPQVGRWMVVHYLQLFLFPLTALTIILLTARRRDWLSIAAAIFLAIYGIGYACFDSIAGIGTGVLVADANEFSAILGDDVPADFEPIINETIQSYYHSPSVTRIVVVSIAAAITGFIITAISLYQSGHGWFPVVMLAGACWGVTKTHAPPYGPITYGFLFAAAVYVVFFSSKRESVIDAST